jgi:hypothetical protein
MIASSPAVSAASQRVATPDNAPVRNWPSAKASITARSAPESASKRISSGVAPPSVCAQVFVPTMPATANAAPMACKVLPTPHCTCVFNMFCAVPLASATSPLSTAAMAPRMSSTAATSASVIHSAVMARRKSMAPAVAAPAR